MDAVTDFLVGSSWPATIISMVYIGRGYMRTPPADHPIPFQYIVWSLPALFGLSNVLLSRYTDGSRLTMILAGALFGFALSNIGTRIWSMPEKVFGFSAKDKFVPMILAPLLYAFVWGVVVYSLNSRR